MPLTDDSSAGGVGYAPYVDYITTEKPRRAQFKAWIQLPASGLCQRYAITALGGVTIPDS